MENPASWNLLTASVAACDLEDLSESWAFLVLQGLVRDEERDRLEFASIVRHVRGEGAQTGPSEARRIASQLVLSGLCLPAYRKPDPGGAIARARAETVRGWREEPSPYGTASIPRPAVDG